MKAASIRTFGTALPPVGGRKWGLIAGSLTAIALLIGAAWLGETLRHSLVKPRPVPDKIVEIVMPPELTPTPPVKSTQSRQPSPIAPPRQSETLPPPTVKPPFTQPIQPPTTGVVDGKAITIPLNPGGVGPEGGIFDLKDLDQQPSATYQPNPTYPYEMRKEGVSGRVIVRFTVDPHGNVINAVAIDSSDRAFNDSAVQAVSRWRFTPGKKDGRAVYTRMEIPIVFTLDGH